MQTTKFLAPPSRRTGIRLMSVLAALGAGSLLFQIGPGRSGVIVAVASMPALACAYIVTRFDRHEPEPRRLPWMTFAFGVTVAIASSLVLHALVQGVASGIFGAQAASHLGSVAIAPLVEELAKGAAVFGIYYWLRDEFNGVIDGIVYSALVGLGFAFTENISYYTNAMTSGTGAFVAVAVLRGGLSAFSHPLFTSMIVNDDVKLTPLRRFETDPLSRPAS